MKPHHFSWGSKASTQTLNRNCFPSYFLTKKTIRQGQHGSETMAVWCLSPSCTRPPATPCLPAGPRPSWRYRLGSAKCDPGSPPSLRRVGKNAWEKWGKWRSPKWREHLELGKMMGFADHPHVWAIFAIHIFFWNKATLEGKRVRRSKDSLVPAVVGADSWGIYTTVFRLEPWTMFMSHLSRGMNILKAWRNSTNFGRSWKKPSEII